MWVGAALYGVVIGLAVGVAAVDRVTPQLTGWAVTEITKS